MFITPMTADVGVQLEDESFDIKYTNDEISNIQSQECTDDSAVRSRRVLWLRSVGLLTSNSVEDINMQISSFRGEYISICKSLNVPMDQVCVLSNNSNPNFVNDLSIDIWNDVTKVFATRRWFNEPETLTSFHRILFVFFKHCLHISFSPNHLSRLLGIIMLGVYRSSLIKPSHTCSAPVLSILHRKTIEHDSFLIFRALLSNRSTLSTINLNLEESRSSIENILLSELNYSFPKNLPLDNHILITELTAQMSRLFANDLYNIQENIHLLDFILEDSAALYNVSTLSTSAPKKSVSTNMPPLHLLPYFSVSYLIHRSIPIMINNSKSAIMEAVEKLPFAKQSKSKNKKLPVAKLSNLLAGAVFLRNGKADPLSDVPNFQSKSVSPINANKSSQKAIIAKKHSKSSIIVKRDREDAAQTTNKKTEKSGLNLMLKHPLETQKNSIQTIENTSVTSLKVPTITDSDKEKNVIELKSPVDLIIEKARNTINTTDWSGLTWNKTQEVIRQLRTLAVSKSIALQSTSEKNASSEKKRCRVCTLPLQSCKYPERHSNPAACSSLMPSKPPKNPSKPSKPSSPLAIKNPFQCTIYHSTKRSRPSTALPHLSSQRPNPFTARFTSSSSLVLNDCCLLSSVANPAHKTHQATNSTAHELSSEIPSCAAAIRPRSAPIGYSNYGGASVHTCYGPLRGVIAMTPISRPGSSCNAASKNHPSACERACNLKHATHESWVIHPCASRQSAVEPAALSDAEGLIRIWQKQRSGIVVSGISSQTSGEADTTTFGNEKLLGVTVREAMKRLGVTIIDAGSSKHGVWAGGIEQIPSRSLIPCTPHLSSCAVGRQLAKVEILRQKKAIAEFRADQLARRVAEIELEREEKDKKILETQRKESIRRKRGSWLKRKLQNFREASPLNKIELNGTYLHKKQDQNFISDEGNNLISIDSNITLSESDIEIKFKSPVRVDRESSPLTGGSTNRGIKESVTNNIRLSPTFALHESIKLVEQSEKKFDLLFNSPTVTPPLNKITDDHHPNRVKDEEIYNEKRKRNRERILRLPHSSRINKRISPYYLHNVWKRNMNKVSLNYQQKSGETSKSSTDEINTFNAIGKESVTDEGLDIQIGNSFKSGLFHEEIGNEENNYRQNIQPDSDSLMNEISLSTIQKFLGEGNDETLSLSDNDDALSLVMVGSNSILLNDCTQNNFGDKSYLSPPKVHSENPTIIFDDSSDHKIISGQTLSDIDTTLLAKEETWTSLSQDDFEIPKNRNLTPNLISLSEANDTSFNPSLLSFKITPEILKASMLDCNIQVNEVSTKKQKNPKDIFPHQPFKSKNMLYQPKSPIDRPVVFQTNKRNCRLANHRSIIDQGVAHKIQISVNSDTLDAGDSVTSISAADAPMETLPNFLWKEAALSVVCRGGGKVAEYQEEKLKNIKLSMK